MCQKELYIATISDLLTEVTIYKSPSRICRFPLVSARMGFYKVSSCVLEIKYNNIEKTMGACNILVVAHVCNFF